VICQCRYCKTLKNIIVFYLFEHVEQDSLPPGLLPPKPFGHRPQKPRHLPQKTPFFCFTASTSLNVFTCIFCIWSTYTFSTSRSNTLPNELLLEEVLQNPEKGAAAGDDVDVGWVGVLASRSYRVSCCRHCCSLFRRIRCSLLTSWLWWVDSELTMLASGAASRWQILVATSSSSSTQRHRCLAVMFCFFIFPKTTASAPIINWKLQLLYNLSSSVRLLVIS
jgi:hypothetical protein